MDTMTPRPAAGRAAAIAAHGSVCAALDAGAVLARVTLSLAEAVLLGLISQGVRTFVGVLGHGSTALAREIEEYEAAGVVRFVGVRHETEAAHAATALRVATGERAAVVTSIGPGALQAFAGSLTSALNGVGVWHLYGDATTEAEGPNMQDLPGAPQLGWQRLTATMGESYSLHTPQAVTEALRRGAAVVDDPYRPGPFFLLLPINVQPALIADFNLRRLPPGGSVRRGPAAPPATMRAARELVGKDRVVVKVGGGAASLGPQLGRLLDRLDAVAVLTPNSIGVLPPDHPRNMLVGGSKGSISGNFAMEHADALVVLGARAVCQSDCSRTGYPNVSRVVNINADTETATHYAHTVALVGDLEYTIDALCDELDQQEAGDDRQPSQWLHDCRVARERWDEYLGVRVAPRLLKDPRWGRGVLSQAAALHAIENWARDKNAIRWYDAGDVQATAFQIAGDAAPEESFTDGGASYMGFGTSALLSTALSAAAPYSVSVVGDGSFLMNPQALVDGMVHGARGMIIVLDNRRMGAISALQEAQYGTAYATYDDATIDYVALASAIDGVTATSGDGAASALVSALDGVYGAGGVGLVHVPVYYGTAPEGSVDSFGRWNVGPWVADTQALRHGIDL
ncbi:MAG: thiamine pyrophosphate-binding protein [Acidimicrobiaceae bacterium]|nr:thiamine pyrophosphate-binding protein [Acidimicrobiia bacterium]MCY4493982.1 thiamine pyrophosphate-binding protein [Acidimicrobiaceae bacterium]